MLLPPLPNSLPGRPRLLMSRLSAALLFPAHPLTTLQDSLAVPAARLPGLSVCLQPLLGGQPALHG